MTQNAGRWQGANGQFDAIQASEAHRRASKDWPLLPKWLADHYEQGNVLFINHPLRVGVIVDGRWIEAHESDWIIHEDGGALYVEALASWERGAYTTVGKARDASEPQSSPAKPAVDAASSPTEPDEHTTNG